MKDGKLQVVIAPTEAQANTFPKQFANSIASKKFELHTYNYEPALPEFSDILILHWPNDFFLIHPPEKEIEFRRLLDMWKAAKAERNLRLIWAAHNLHPHEGLPCPTALARLFLDSLDGIIYFSDGARGLVRELYGVRPPHELVTVHGHYRDDRVAAPRPPPATDGPIKLGYFGRVRPYKGLEKLIACMGQLQDSQTILKISGKRLNLTYAATIEKMAAGNQKIITDLRDEFLSEIDLELAVDGCHGVVLPYSAVLNSGSTMFALSRNRPVLAPNAGSLPELQAGVTSHWLQIYNGELTPNSLDSFIKHLREGLAECCDLSAYNWGPIGESLRHFIYTVHKGA